MFESPWLLLGLALVVPTVLAFLFRHRERLATVPSTLLFRRVALSRIKNRRLKSLVRRLAAAACVAAVAALALAAAQPRLAGATSSTAIVVDVSASMRGAPFEEARAAVARMLRQRHGNEHVVIVAAGARPRHLVGPTTSSTLLEGAADALTPERGEADLVAALELADRLMRSRRRGRVVVITDGGAASVEDTVELEAPLSVLRVGEARANLGVTVLAARPPADARDDSDREVLVTVAAASLPDGADPSRRADLIFEADGVELERRALEIPAGGEAEATLRLLAPAERLTVRVEPTDGHGDDLAADDRATLALGPGRAPRVHLVATDDAPARFFVERALRAAGVSEIEAHAPGEAPARLEEGALAVVLGEAPAHPIEGPALYLATTTGALPVRVARRLDPESGTALRSVDARHPLTRGVELDEATIEAAVAIEPPADAASVIELDGGTVVATGGTGRARWVYLGVDPAGSDLVLRVAFPVLVANALAALVGATDVRTAETLPRSEVSLRPTAVLARASEADAPWPLPTSVAVLLAVVAAALLLGEGLAYQKGWSR